eukprot:symbB.v1.2.037936.t1/scaffold5745.1/size24029/2
MLVLASVMWTYHAASCHPTSSLEGHEHFDSELGKRSPAPTRRGSSAMGRSAGGADHEMELEELRKQIQGALESRSTAILQQLVFFLHYKEAMQRDVNEKGTVWAKRFFLGPTRTRCQRL